MEGALLTRVYGVADPTEVGDLAYLEGLRAAAAAGVDFGLATIEASQDRLPLVPPALLAQARLAARSGVGLDTVLRRYTAGHALLVDFLVEEVERGGGLSAAELRRLLAVISAAIDRLLVAISEEHARELESHIDFSREGRLAERVQRLLAGEPVDASDLRYDFGGWHLGIVARGEGAQQQIRTLVTDLDCRTLLVDQGDAIAWAWLGTREPLDPALVRSCAEPHRDIALALGEPAADLPGWRFTHRQALAVLPVALRGEERAVRYSEAALIAAVLDNELLRTSLRRLYLDPLAGDCDGGETLRQTLSVYFDAGGNVSSVAAAMGVSRPTIRNRIERIERLIGRSCRSATAELGIALRLHDHLQRQQAPD